MAKLTVKIGDSLRHIPDGEYKAIVRDIHADSFIKQRKSFVIKFEVAEGEHKGVALNSYLNGQYETFSARTKLFQWYSTVAGYEPDTGDEINLEMFQDKLLKVKVETKISKKTGQKFSNVTNVLEVVCEL